MNEVTILMTSLHQRDFTVNCIKGYQKFCPESLNMKIIVVENSDDISYRDDVLSMGDKIEWINNETESRGIKGTDAYTNSIEVGMSYVDTDYVLLSHNDICITGVEFFHSMMAKANDGYELVGTCSDIHPDRNKCIIMLGCLVKSYIINTVDLYQKPYPDGSPHFEAGDRIHLYCRDNDLKHMCFTNSHNNPEIVDDLPEPYKSLDYTVRTINDDGEVIFLHFARGATKTHGQYKKKGRLTVPQIVEWCEENIYKD